MNLENVELPPPLRVVMINPLSPEAKMFAIKIFNGLVFGFDQFINMILLVYSNEIDEAKDWKRRLESTTPPCYNSVEIITDLPSVEDGDVFIIYTMFRNPNIFDFEDTASAECFDSLYLLLKVATHLVIPEKTKEKLEEEEREVRRHYRRYGKILTKRKPIFISDGLVPIDILHTFSTNVPSDSFFCPTPVPAIATSILGDHLRVLCSDINRLHIFGANDKVFHIEYERPLFVKDIRPEHRVENLDDLLSVHDNCEWDLVGSERCRELNLDYTVFNAAWMKKDFIEKVKTVSSSNLHGPLFKSARMTKALHAIWLTRGNPKLIPNFRAVGAISDGSMDTIKGLPYVFPLNFYGDTWKVNTYFKDDFFVKSEIKKYNKIVLEQHRKLIPFCRKFLEENVIQQKFVVDDKSSSSSSAYASLEVPTISSIADSSSTSSSE